MLTRLEVDGFKNLKNLDIRFGPFTCIAGPNGVGKSNIFDVISFLAALATESLIEAAQSVRGGGLRPGDVRGLFHCHQGVFDDRMRLAAEFLIPENGEDVLGQEAQASMTFLRYELELTHQSGFEGFTQNGLRVVHESMVHLKKGNARQNLKFPHKKAWLDSVIRGRRGAPYISSARDKDGQVIVALHADSHGTGGGSKRKLLASTLPRTVLSSVNNAAEHRTLVLARQEMASWSQLMLEPSALRASDHFNAPTTVAANGANMPATLYALGQSAEFPDNLYSDVASRLAQLLEDVRRIDIDLDDRRQLINIVLTDANKTEYPASALSDGTLRFLALAIMEVDTRGRRLICMEEPENGMHPSRLEAVLEILTDLAVDPMLSIGDDNPMRQVIINTHAPAVVSLIPDHALLMAHVVKATGGDKWLSIRHLEGTWRDDKRSSDRIDKGELRRYLDPLAGASQMEFRRVIDRKDLQLYLPLRRAHS